MQNNLSFFTYVNSNERSDDQKSREHFHVVYD